MAARPDKFVLLRAFIPRNLQGMLYNNFIILILISIKAKKIVGRQKRPRKFGNLRRGPVMVKSRQVCGLSIFVAIQLPVGFFF